MQEATTDGSKAACKSYRAKPAALTKRELKRESLAKNLAVANLGGYRHEANQEKENLHAFFFNNNFKYFFRTFFVF